MTAPTPRLACLIGLSVVLAAPGGSVAQESVIIRWAGQAVKSPAAKWFAATAAGYLFGKSADGIWAELSKPDRAELDRRIGQLQTQFPDYRADLDGLKRFVKPDVKKDEFENLFKDMVTKIDQGKTRPQAPVEVPLGQLGLPLRPRPSAFEFDKYLLAPGPARVAPTLRGAWAFELSSPDGASHTAYCHVFGAGGEFLSYRIMGGDAIDRGAGTYTLEQRAVTIRWASGNVDRATVDFAGDNLLRYELAGDPGQPRWTAFLTRVSDPVTTSLIAVSNPTADPILFETRWALMDGVWTQWKPWTIKPFSTLRVTGRGGIHCQVRFDASFEPGRQEAFYCLPFDTVTAPSDPLPASGGTPYRFEVRGDQIDLKRDDSTAPAADAAPPGVNAFTNLDLK
jgi:hypothetical protein